MNQETKNAVWRAIVGDDVLIPAPNSDVVYRPRVHLLQYSNGPIEIAEDLPEQVHSSVESVKLEFSEVLAYPFVEYTLNPSIQAPLHPHGELYNDGMNREMFRVFKKEVTYAEMGGTCLLKETMADQLFPGKPLVVTLLYTDGTQYSFNFKNYKISHGWGDFMAAKGININDVLVFVKMEAGGDPVILGVQKRSGAHRIEGEETTKAVESAAKNLSFVVRMFPGQINVEPCVALH